MTRILIILLILIQSLSVHAKRRDELYRYTLMRDRVLIDRSLKDKPYNSFFNLEILLSSGLKGLIGDVQDGNRSGLSSAQKQTNMLQILNQNVNTAKYVDADIHAAIPLPRFRLSNFNIDTGIFYQLNFGVSLSISNQESVTNPSVSTYIKKETKFGVDALFVNNPSEHYGIRYYQLTRADLLSSLSYSTLATEGELFEFDDLSKNQVTYNFDLRYHKAYENFKMLLEVNELKLMEGTVEKVAFYESRPLFHAQYEYPFVLPMKGSFYFGITSRFKYAIDRGLYGAMKLRVLKEVPFYIYTKLSNQYLTFVPKFQSKYFHISYTLKTPIENPQDELWHSTLHAMEINFPFF